AGGAVNGAENRTRAAESTAVVATTCRRPWTSIVFLHTLSVEREIRLLSDRAPQCSLDFSDLIVGVNSSANATFAVLRRQAVFLLWAKSSSTVNQSSGASLASTPVHHVPSVSCASPVNDTRAVPSSVPR